MLDPAIVADVEAVFREPEVERKLALAARLAGRRLAVAGRRGSGDMPPRPPPARPDSWSVLPAFRIRERPDLGTARGRLLLLHSVAHIEVSAVELALLAVADFADEDVHYHRDMLGIAAEEVAHARLLIEELRRRGMELGEEPVHLALWETAVQVRSLPERLVVVPRILEARGLDVSSGLRRRLQAVGDAGAAAILDRIYHDEIRHVAVGTRWHRRACAARGIEPEEHFLAVARPFRARRGVPLDVEARRSAGFTERELAGLAVPAAHS